MVDQKEENALKKLRQDCWNDALHTFGTGYLYSLRAETLRNKLKAITFLGIVTPALVGLIALGYEPNSTIFIISVAVAIPIGILQLALSILSVTYGWNDLYPNYVESSIENSFLARQYEQLAKFPPQVFDELKREKEKIDIKKSGRDKEDNKNSLSEKERRKGMRWALRNYKRSCAGCNQIPTSMNSTTCDICGDFKTKLFK